MTYPQRQPPADDEVWGRSDSPTNVPPGIPMGVRRQGDGTPRCAFSGASPRGWCSPADR